MALSVRSVRHLKGGETTVELVPGRLLGYIFHTARWARFCHSHSEPHPQPQPSKLLYNDRQVSQTVI
jgi:hypothetical protein